MQNSLTTNGWQWVTLGSYEFEAGDHNLSIGYREDGAQLDKVAVSTGAFAPNGFGPDAENACE